MRNEKGFNRFILILIEFGLATPDLQLKKIVYYSLNFSQLMLILMSFDDVNDVNDVYQNSIKSPHAFFQCLVCGRDIFQ